MLLSLSLRNCFLLFLSECLLIPIYLISSKSKLLSFVVKLIFCFLLFDVSVNINGFTHYNHGKNIYFWRMETLLKWWKIPKYYVQDCLRFSFGLSFEFLEIALFLLKEECSILKNTTNKSWKLSNDLNQTWEIMFKENCSNRTFPASVTLHTLILKVWEKPWI